MTLKEIINIIESVAPLGQQEEWDNSGLQVGNREAEINSALLTVDVTEAVVNEAVKKKCDLIISHHPLIFHGLYNLTSSTPQQRCVENAIKHNIAIYSAHTSLDCALNGVSGRMAEKLGISQYRILAPHINSNGDIAPYGLGVIGEMAEPMTADSFLQLVQQTFNTQYIRYIQPPKKEVQRIAMCGGAGADLLSEAIKQKADVYISADIKYHEMQQGIGRIMIVDIDHWTSEQFTRELLDELLKEKIKTYISASDSSPVHIFK